MLMLTSLVFPCLFYLFLNAGEQKANEERRKMGQKGKKALNNGMPIAGGNNSSLTDNFEEEEGQQLAGWSE